MYEGEIPRREGSRIARQRTRLQRRFFVVTRVRVRADVVCRCFFSCQGTRRLPLGNRYFSSYVEKYAYEPLESKQKIRL